MHRDFSEKIQAMAKEKKLTEAENRIYRKMEQELVGKIFQEGRHYGHAKYKVVGGHAAWKTVRDAQKIYGHLNEVGEWVFQYHHRAGFCLAVVRLGGYGGQPNPQAELRRLLEPYRLEILEIRGQ